MPETTRRITNSSHKLLALGQPVDVAFMKLDHKPQRRFQVQDAAFFPSLSAQNDKTVSVDIEHMKTIGPPGFVADAATDKKITSGGSSGPCHISETSGAGGLTNFRYRGIETCHGACGDNRWLSPHSCCHYFPVPPKYLSNQSANASMSSIDFQKSPQP